MAGMPRCSTSALRAMAMEDTQHSMRAVILRISSDAKSDMTRRVKDQITWGVQTHRGGTQHTRVTPQKGQNSYVEPGSERTQQ